MSSSTEKTRRLVGISLFTALVVVLQLVATFLPMKPFTITLALTPIVVGAALYGPKAGAWLGGVFGVVVLIACMIGADAGGAILWNASPLTTALLCIIKGAAAGLAAGLVYRAIAGKDSNRVLIGVIAAAVVSPVVNTGIFCTAMATLYHPILVEWASGAGAANVVYYIFIGLIGVNFIVELLVNSVLSPVVARIIKVGKKGVS
ncbi:MAG: ECF transporter S component [Oscillospiraceae bacterium]